MTNNYLNVYNYCNQMIDFEGKAWPRIALCVGCGSQIMDQYILRVSPDLEWHAACLKCADCHQFLDESCTCFVRDGKTYCKRDYLRYVYIDSTFLYETIALTIALTMALCLFASMAPLLSNFSSFTV